MQRRIHGGQWDSLLSSVIDSSDLLSSGRDVRLNRTPTAAITDTSHSAGPGCGRVAIGGCPSKRASRPRPVLLGGKRNAIGWRRLLGMSMLRRTCAGFPAITAKDTRRDGTQVQTRATKRGKLREGGGGGGEVTRPGSMTVMSTLLPDPSSLKMPDKIASCTRSLH